jgi:hypothetical protein
MAMRKIRQIRGIVEKTMPELLWFEIAIAK